MENPHIVYDETENASGDCSKLQSPEDELGEWSQYKQVPPTDSSSPPPKDLTDSKTKSLRLFGCMVFFFISLPSGYHAIIIGLALYEPTVHRWFKKYYLTVYIAFGATLVLFFVHIFPRVKAHPPLNILFSTLFLTAFVYLAAVLSVIIGTATPFMCNLIMFVACWQLMACSLLGVQFDSAKGRWTCALIYLADFIIVAIFLPSRIIDKIVAFFVTVCVAKVQISKVNEVIEKALQEQDAV